VVTLAGQAETVTEVKFAPGGDLLASGGADGSIQLWDVSGKIGTEPDLYSYLSNHWYRFEPDTQQLVPDGGIGFANVPTESIIDLWQKGGAGVFPRLLKAGDWAGALQALSEMSATPPKEAVEKLRAALVADADQATASYQWNRLALRIEQLKKIGVLDAPELKKRRDAVAAEGSDFTDGDGLEMVWCPPTGPKGFLMGSPGSESGHKRYENQHRVVLTSGFWIGRYEVTQEQWTAVTGSNLSLMRADEKGAPRRKAPAESMDWNEAMDFCRKLTDRERTRGAVPVGWEYTLPTEAQWEYACRAGTDTSYYFGNDPEEFYKYGNYKDHEIGSSVPPKDGFIGTAPVGSYPPNPWKLYDMHGNVSEMCRDAFNWPLPNYPEDKVVDPLQTGGPARINRGGGHLDKALDCRSAGRYGNRVIEHIADLGLRAVLTRIRPTTTEQ
jgi:formylglycine-generating enzyme required for sulfatase activity